MSETTSGGEEEASPKQIPDFDLDTVLADFRYLSGEDDAAVREAQLFNSGQSAEDLEKEAKKREQDRAQRFLDHFEMISICGMWLLFIVFGILGVIWASSLVFPDCWQFLTRDQLEKLQLVITGGFVTGIATSHLKKRLGP